MKRPLSFILFLAAVVPALAQNPPALLRGPYLQRANPTSLTVCWRTNLESECRVRYGTDFNNLDQFRDEDAEVTDHWVRLTGLAPATKYFYQVEVGATVLAGGPTYFFTTPPAVGSTGPLRIWALGDCGTASSNALAVRNAFAPLHLQKPADFMLMLGDNAYGTGLDTEYQRAVFDFYTPYLQQIPLWSCIGNHETYSGLNQGQYAYDRIFEFPTAGECGGVASGTERYYSFDYANIHFVCLDAMTSVRSANGPMANWLRTDLEANVQAWTVAFWHHPPYTKGSHDSDWEIELIEMRQNLVPILESHGVDLVLCGHSHCYERSFLIDGHYGTSDTFSVVHVRDGGSGREDGGGAYQKATIGPAAHEGAVYVVAGSSGQISGGTFDHPAMFYSAPVLGSLVIDVSGSRMDVKFLRETTAPGNPPIFGDYFTLKKGPAAPPAAPGDPSVLPISSTTALVHWEDNSDNEEHFVIELSTDEGETYTAVETAPTNATFRTISNLLPETSYLVRVVAHNQLGDAASESASFTQPDGASVTDLQGWRFSHFGTINAAGPAADLADPDLDGQANLLEYGLGSIPTRPLSMAAVTASTDANGRLVLTFGRLARPELTYIVEFSDDLATGGWTPALTTNGAANIAGPVTVIDPQLNAPVRRFARVRVVLNP